MLTKKTPILFLAILFLAGCGRSAEAPGPTSATSGSVLTPEAILTPYAAIPSTPGLPSPTLSISPSSAPLETPTLRVLTNTSTTASTATAGLIPATGSLTGAELVQALRAGGYVIYFRHAATDPIPDDQVPVNLQDCNTQRHLSSAGQEQARQIGQAVQRLGLPIGRVLSSPFCRAQDTARLAFGKADVEPALENLETASDDAEREQRTASLRQLLSTPPEPGTNTILVAHGINLSGAAQTVVPEGGAAIFQPLASAGFALVASLPSNEWANLEHTLQTETAVPTGGSSP